MQKLSIVIAVVALFACQLVSASTDNVVVYGRDTDGEWLDEHPKHIGFTYSAGFNVVSGYLWRGFQVGGLSFQPAVSVGYGGLSVGLWWNLGAKDNTFRGFFPEMDTYISFSRWGLLLKVTHMHYFNGSRFFDFRQKDIYGGGNSNNTELTIGYRVSDKLPLSIEWNTHIGSEDGYVVDQTDNFVKRQLDPTDNAQGLRVKRAFSTYIQIGYDFTLPYQIELPVKLGMTPWRSRYTHYEGSFAVCMISLGLRRDFDLNICKLNVFGTVTLNPNRINQDNLIVRISERDFTDNRTSSHLCGMIGMGVWF